MRFFCHNPSDECGFGGSKFDLTLLDGSKITIKGPWSSRAGAMNRHFSPCVDVHIKERDGKHPTLRYVMAISLELAQRAAEMAGVTLERVARE